MPKNRYTVKEDPNKDYCPRCLKKDKKVERTGEKMAKHYRIKHPGKALPDRFYTGPRSIAGDPITQYSGLFSVGTRVRLVGVEKEFPTECPEGCGKVRKTEEKMRWHLLVKHKIKHYHLEPRFTIDGEGRQIEGEIEKNNSPVGKRGTVFDVTPAGFGGPKIPALIHIHLDKPFKLKYYDKWGFTCLESELKRLKSKVEDDE